MSEELLELFLPIIDGRGEADEVRGDLIEADRDVLDACGHGGGEGHGCPKDHSGLWIPNTTSHLGWCSWGWWLGLEGQRLGFGGVGRGDGAGKRQGEDQCLEREGRR